ncbi:hypothetical protein FRAAL1881 [Frankia alni ACN14a]|uniref:Uncharacterized protein n=1 Tax=Frankia alni (strain DSM 45986 / CECT 9034 / ACN14a) TaxID=326424 RepID=Q0RPK0_FRAAA|nr:hypothetical protein FRAAL1881 [Frankia alni ACN14a]
MSLGRSIFGMQASAALLVESDPGDTEVAIPRPHGRRGDLHDRPRGYPNPAAAAPRPARSG